jgi:CRISPR-associated protein Cas2
MHMLVTYDVNTETKAGRRRLRKVAEACKNFGQRAQKSVFECDVQERHFERLRAALLKIIDKDQDSLRIYRLMEPVEKHRETYGKNLILDLNEPIIL